MLCVKNGMIHDGIHPEAFRGDILVEDGKIKAIGENLEAGEETESWTRRGCACIRDSWRLMDILGLTVMALAMRGWITTR